LNKKLLGWGLTALPAFGVHATVQAFQSVLVRARVDGAIDRVAFTEGHDVKAGDLLAVIDPRRTRPRWTRR